MSQVPTGRVVEGLLAQPTQHFSVVPNQFGTRDCFRGIVFHRPGLNGCGLEIVQRHCIYCAIYLYYYYISFALDHQALNPGGWGPLVQATVVWYLLWRP